MKIQELYWKCVAFIIVHYMHPYGNTIPYIQVGTSHNFIIHLWNSSVVTFTTIPKSLNQLYPCFMQHVMPILLKQLK